MSGYALFAHAAVLAFLLACAAFLHPVLFGVSCIFVAVWAWVGRGYHR
jgi:hypothetical protein